MVQPSLSQQTMRDLLSHLTCLCLLCTYNKQVIRNGHVETIKPRQLPRESVTVTRGTCRTFFTMLFVDI